MSCVLFFRAFRGDELWSALAQAAYSSARSTTSCTNNRMIRADLAATKNRSSVDRELP